MVDCGYWQVGYIGVHVSSCGNLSGKTFNLETNIRQGNPAVILLRIGEFLLLDFLQLCGPVMEKDLYGIVMVLGCPAIHFLCVFFIDFRPDQVIASWSQQVYWHSLCKKSSGMAKERCVAGDGSAGQWSMEYKKDWFANSTCFKRNF